jgi:hypothetical protein
MPSGHLKAHQQNKAMSLSPKDINFIEARHVLSCTPSA